VTQYFSLGPPPERPFPDMSEIGGETVDDTTQRIKE